MAVTAMVIAMMTAMATKMAMGEDNYDGDVDGGL